MNIIEQIMLRTKAALEKQNAMETKANDYESLVREKIRADLHAISKCPFHLCDGSGMIFDKKTNTGWHCKCHQVFIQQNKLKFAQIPKEFAALKVNDFQTNIYTDKEAHALACTAKSIAIGYVKNFDQNNGKGLYFYSQTKGSGKTRLMVSIGNALIHTQNKSVRFITTNTLLDEIKSTFEQQEDGGRYSELVTSLKQIDVLILDDMGAERPTPWVNEIFYGLLNDRMTAGKPTLFTSNYPIEELGYNTRIIDRLFRMAMPVKFPEESVRQMVAKQENEAFLNELLKD